MRPTHHRSQIDKEIEDVSDGELEDLPRTVSAIATPVKPAGVARNDEAQPAAPAAAKRGLMPGGLSGGASLGGNAPLKPGPKNHTYEIVNGEAKARVYDTPVSF
jgi:hypothetical protein